MQLNHPFTSTKEYLNSCQSFVTEGIPARAKMCAMPTGALALSFCAEVIPGIERPWDYDSGIMDMRWDSGRKLFVATWVTDSFFSGMGVDDGYADLADNANTIHVTLRHQIEGGLDASVEFGARLRGGVVEPVGISHANDVFQQFGPQDLGSHMNTILNRKLRKTSFSAV